MGINLRRYSMAKAGTFNNLGKKIVFYYKPGKKL
jgi:hypothetical protein